MSNLRSNEIPWRTGRGVEGEAGFLDGVLLGAGCLFGLAFLLVGFFEGAVLEVVLRRLSADLAVLEVRLFPIRLLSPRIIAQMY
jgi:hypothetical protein